MDSDIKVQDNSVAIVGWQEGLAGLIHSWLEKTNEYHIACFVNPKDEPIEIDPTKISRDATQFSYPTKDRFKNKPLINSSNWAKRLKTLGINRVLVTTDEPLQRFEEINQAKAMGMELINAIHPSVLIMEDVILHDNIIILAGSLIGYRAEIFSGVIISGAHFNHHDLVKECATIDPGVFCSGNVTIGRFTRVHTGAIIKNRIRIGENSTIGAGAIILNDVPDNVVVANRPGKITFSKS